MFYILPINFYWSMPCSTLSLGVPFDRERHPSCWLAEKEGRKKGGQGWVGSVGGNEAELAYTSRTPSDSIFFFFAVTFPTVFSLFSRPTVLSHSLTLYLSFFPEHKAQKRLLVELAWKFSSAYRVSFEPLLFFPCLPRQSISDLGLVAIDNANFSFHPPCLPSPHFACRILCDPFGTREAQGFSCKFQ